MKRLIALTALSLSTLAAQNARTIPATQDCTITPCYSSVNIPFDGEGAPITPAPGYWGSQTSVMTKVAFEGVPAGYVVRVHRIRGNFIAWAHGKVPAGANAGLLWSVQTTQSLGSDSPTNVEYGTNGCFTYQQGSVNATNLLAQFDTDLDKDVVILTDGVLWSKEAVWLNDTGLSVHSEITFVITYSFVKP